MAATQIPRDQDHDGGVMKSYASKSQEGGQQTTVLGNPQGAGRRSIDQAANSPFTVAWQGQGATRCQGRVAQAKQGCIWTITPG
jgi:hypothetical protein